MKIHEKILYAILGILIVAYICIFAYLTINTVIECSGSTGRLMRSVWGVWECVR
jgi:hypothetical protein